MALSDHRSPADRPRVGIDGYNLALPRGTGVATYGRNLSRGLRRIGVGVDALYGLDIPPGADGLDQEVAFFDPPKSRKTVRREVDDVVRGAVGAFHGLRARPLRLGGAVRSRALEDRLPVFDRLWNVRRLFLLSHHVFDRTGRRLRVRMADPPAVMHWTYPLAVELVGARNVYTLHDLVPLRLPFTTLDLKARYRALCAMLVREADHIVTVSEASRRDILELLDAPPEKVTNTYQGVEPLETAGRAEAEALVRGAVGLPPQGFHLFFGAVEPKKNVGRLLEAYFRSGVTTPLVLVGQTAWKADEELALLAGNDAGEGRAGRVIRLDHAPRGLLTALVLTARAVLFPSLYEGFGLPVAEAMALGAPVMTSDTSSLPEVAGDAALLVDPYDVQAMAAALRRLDGDAALRADLAARGPRQAARFAPAAYDARLRELYRRLGLPL